MSNAKYRVLIADDLSKRAVEILTAHPEISVEVKTGLKGAELAAAVRGAHAIAVRSATKVTAEVVEAADQLKIVGRAGAGVDTIDVPACSKKGVLVVNTPGGNSITTAEHALFLLFSLVRHIPQATASVKAGKWEKKKFTGTELFGKTLGVIGLGAIGRIVADRALGMRMKVVSCDPMIKKDSAPKHVTDLMAMGVEIVSFDELLERSDLITVHAPLLPETKNLIGASAFAKMKKGTFLVNCARGGIVDEAAAKVALDDGTLAGLALDVFVEEPPPPGHPLLGHDKVICTPHLGAATNEAQEKVAIDVAEQIAAYLLSGEIGHAVNRDAVTRR
jgi:D-3-phosphoglycerate dehydrogenase / 2-oxoglutarate reductase